MRCPKVTIYLKWVNWWVKTLHFVKPKSFVIADEYIDKPEFGRRVEIAKKIGSYLPEKKKWQFSIKVAGGLSGDELAAIIREINSWSEKNNFGLTDMIRYKERKWF